MSSIKGVIFDLDGVIVDTAKYHYKAWKSLANDLGFDFTVAQNEMLKGVSRVRSLEILLDIGSLDLPEVQKQDLLLTKNEEYLSFVNQMSSDEVLDGVFEILNFLDANGINYALGSASKNAPLILEKVGLIHRFKALVDGNNVSKAKPDPEVFLLGAEKLQIQPENCLVFEDAIAGVQAANAANMMSIGIGDSKVLKEADYVFKNMATVSTDFLTNLIK